MSGAPRAVSAAAARRASAVLMWLAAAGVAACFLLISPDDRGERLRPWPDGSWLKWIVRVQALGYAFPTVRGVEVKQVVFHVTAGLLSLGGAAAVIAGSQRARRVALPAWRRAWTSPQTWFAALLAVSLASACASEAPRAALGGSAIRFLWFAWWWPLATCLTQRDARRLLIAIVVAGCAMALVGLAYRTARATDVPLAYPMGNSLIVGSCLLPGLMISGTLAAAHLWPMLVRRRGGSAGGDGPAPAGLAAPRGVVARWRTPTTTAAVWSAAAVLLLCAMVLTQSRSAKLGMGLGLVSAVYLAADRVIRAWVHVIAAMSAGLVGAALLISGGDVFSTAAELVSDLTGRSESIRARMAYEWPFAWRMFCERPVLGGGEGGFARGVGPLVREKQIEDPALLDRAGVMWEDLAHNEVLEMVTSVGLLGTLAMAAALVCTLRGVLRAVDGCVSSRRAAWLVAAGAATIAACGDQLTNVALHRPGYAPAALSVAACAWVLARPAARRARCAERGATGERSGGAARLAGVLTGAGLAATSCVGLGLALFDASACRAQYEAQQYNASGRFEAAIPLADRHARWRLDPARYLNALVEATHARVRAAQGAVESTDAEDLGRALELGNEALERIERLNRIVPRYLQASELEGVACTVLSRASQARGNLSEAQAFAERARAAFRRNREDEPFRIQALLWLWDSGVRAGLDERVRWLRDALRGGEVDARWDALLIRLGPAARPAVEALVRTAEGDLRRAAEQWHDPLSPESLRLAARAAYLSGDLPTALHWANAAVTLYSRAGSRLSKPHSAALHDQARFAFETEPERWHEHLQTLERAYQVLAGRPASGPLPGSMGRTRMRILLYADDEPAAREQARSLTAAEGGGTPDEALAASYLELVAMLAARATGAGAETVLHWARRAAELDPRRAEAHRCTAALALTLGRSDVAAEALRRYRQTEPRHEAADAEIERLRSRFPDSPVWSASATQPAASNAAAAP